MRLMKRYIHILLIVVITGLFLCSKVVYSNSFNLRPPLASNSWKDIENRPLQEGISFLDLIRNIFSSHIAKGIPITLLDVGTGYDAIFTFRVKEIFEKSAIKANVSGIALDTMPHVIEKAKQDGIELRIGRVQDLASMDDEKGKYLIMILNGPEEFLNFPSPPYFFEKFDYLLAAGGIIILRPYIGYPSKAIKEGLKELLEKRIWKVRNFAVPMKNLPTGSKHLTAPLLIWRASDYKEQELFPITPGLSFQQATYKTISGNL